MAGERTPDAGGRIPDLDPAFGDGSTEERVYRLVVGSDESWTAPNVADGLGCARDTAKKYLEWFAELGVFSRQDGHPAGYERNEAYFEWRYVTRLAESHTVAELRENVVELRGRLETYRKRYDAEGPDAVDLAVEVQDLDRDVEEVWDDLTTWASIQDELRLHERARQRLVTDTEPSTA